LSKDSPGSLVASLSFVLLGGVFSLPTGERKASPGTASDEVSAYLLAVGLDAPQPMKAEKNTDVMATDFVQVARALREAPARLIFRTGAVLSCQIWTVCDL
jgi:hypothetical protein